MLFSYKYINHSMEKMQDYIDYIFYKVWCKAPQCDYGLELFNNNTDLKDIIIAFYYTEPKGADFFIKGIENVFLIFKTLSPDEIFQLKTCYQSNNDFENLCNKDPMVVPSTYSDIDLINKNLGAALKSFFVGLYSHEFLSLKVLADKIGSIDDHYTEFVTINDKGKCPFCGLNKIDGKYVHTREAYDHYLPKSKYPFASINFKNLSPTCNKCNSSNKGSKDPLHDIDGVRRKAFYPYSTSDYEIEIDIRLISADICNLKPEDLTITFRPSELEEEIKTWNELFGIEERYKAECCDDAEYWIEMIYDELSNMPLREALSNVIKQSRKFPYKETNFLRKSFLVACDTKKLFQTNDFRL